MGHVVSPMTQRGLICGLVVTLFLIFSCNPASAQKRVALVIGNGAYKSVPRLPNPPNDARDIEASMKRLGFEVTAIVDSNFDTMRKSLNEFGRRAQGADIAVIFFAGHGMEIGGENWLIPVDAELRSDRDAEGEAISLRAAMVQVAGAKTLGLVMLDACRNNPFAAKMQQTTRVRAVERGFSRIEPNNDNVLVAYAARDGTTANDGTGRNSPFTAALLRNLETPGLEIRFLFAKVRDDVLGATRREQQPWVYGSLSSESIYLKAALPAAAPTTPPVISPDEVAWSYLSDSTSMPALRRFMAEYPSSKHKRDAEARIAALEQSNRKPEQDQKPAGPATPPLARPEPATKPIATPNPVIAVPPAATASRDPVVLLGHTGPVRDLAFSADGRKLASSGIGEVKIWNAETWSAKPEMELTPSYPSDSSKYFVSAVAFSPNGEFLASYHSDTLNLWDLKSSKKRVLAENTAGGGSEILAFSRSGNRIFAPMLDHKPTSYAGMMAFETQTGKRQKIDYPGQTISRNPDALARSPDGKLLAAALNEPNCNTCKRAVQLWNGETGVPLRLILAPEVETMMLQVAISPANDMFALATYRGKIYLYDITTGKLLRTIAAHADTRVWSVAFSPDGKTLASGSEDKSIKLWDANTGQLNDTLKGHTAPVRRVIFSSDGRGVVSASDDRSVRVWPLPTPASGLVSAGSSPAAPAK